MKKELINYLRVVYLKINIVKNALFADSVRTWLSDIELIIRFLIAAYFTHFEIIYSFLQLSNQICNSEFIKSRSSNFINGILLPKGELSPCTQFFFLFYRYSRYFLNPKFLQILILEITLKGLMKICIHSFILYQWNKSKPFKKL